MAKLFDHKRRKTAAALGVLLSATLSLGVFAACTPEETPVEEDPKPSVNDSQLLKNGNFEFYGEMDEEDVSKKLNLISSPNDWTFSSGSPSSDTASGIVDITEWDYLSRRGTELTTVEDALAKWETNSVTAYDRLQFYKDQSITSADSFELYDDYKYSIDFEDVEYLHEVTDSGAFRLHDHDAQVEAGETGILMIHNRRTSDGVRGTAQYYTSSTTITLNAGTAAKVGVWVKTSNLYHYAEADNVELTKRGGAYIGVTHTVGGTTLDQMQIKNINTKDVTENNGWKQYFVYIRANTFASTTFRIVLGLGQGSSDNRYEAVDGYAFFDDVTCDIISDADYEKAVADNTLNVPGEEGNFCELNSKADAKKFLATDRTTGAILPNNTFALDLAAGFDDFDFQSGGHEFFTVADDPLSFGLTEEVSGSRSYTSAKIDPSLADNTSSTAVEDARKSITGKFSYDELSAKAATNGYLRTAFENDFENAFPSTFSKDNILLLLSTNGAAYTAKLPAFTLPENTRMLISFFVKTSSIRTGRSGAGATLIDGENKTSITPFDSTTVSKVDIDSEDPEKSDIYKGWVHCFFFVSNETDSAKTFRIELTYGPTAIASSTKSNYCDGYAAFANFETSVLTKTQVSYATSGTYAQKVSLTQSVKDESKFDDASASGPQLEEGLSLPANYTGVLAGSNVLVDGGGKNPNKDSLADMGIFTGLLSSENADKYLPSAEEGETVPAWKTALSAHAGNATDGKTWWTNLFGNDGNGYNTAYQPLVILNTNKDKAVPSYGFFAGKTSFSADTANRITVRVKLSTGATAYIYLTDVSDPDKGFDTRLSPAMPAVTYWYDDDGNIVTKDPSGKDFDKKTDIAFTREENGLYSKAGDESGTLYANLSNFDTDDEKNLVTTDGTVAYYFNAADSKYYAYFDEETGTYSQVVEALPTTGSFVRYSKPATLPEAVIKVEGTEANKDKWVTVSFYVQTGNADKSYRVELWAGDRTDTSAGIPADGYVFFDRFVSESISNFDSLRDEAIDKLKRANDLGADDLLPENLALYYTFTFFDSADYLRYDASQDTEKLGNHWANYVQSEHDEEVIWLHCTDPVGNLLGTTSPSDAVFIDYSAVEQTVTPLDLSVDDEPADDHDHSATDENAQKPNIWLLISSGALAFVLVFVIILLIVRRVLARVKKNSSAKPKKEKKEKTKAPKAPKAQPEEKPAAPKDENDPYNE